MYKRILTKDDNEIIASYPADSHTSFYVEGRDDYYTIIDAASIISELPDKTTIKTYVMLESNNFGEEDVIVVYLGRGIIDGPFIISRYNKKPIDTNLSEKATNVVFIRQLQVRIDQCYDDLQTMLEEDNFTTESDTVIRWEQEEIDAINKYQEVIR